MDGERDGEKRVEVWLGAGGGGSDESDLEWEVGRIGVEREAVGRGRERLLRDVNWGWEGGDGMRVYVSLDCGVQDPGQVLGFDDERYTCSNVRNTNVNGISST